MVGTDGRPLVCQVCGKPATSYYTYSPVFGGQTLIRCNEHGGPQDTVTLNQLSTESPQPILVSHYRS